MAILVTGAAGFIGFHLALKLKNEGHEVVGFDNFNNYYDVNLKLMRSAILNDRKILVINGDINDTGLLFSLIAQHGIKTIVHLAAQAGVRYSFEHPEKYSSSNLTGFVSILEAARKNRTKLIFASSSSVYGANKKIPFSEEDRTDQPLNLYGATKKAGELIAYSYSSLYDLSVIGLRFFTVYGPFGRPDMSYFSFAEKIAKGQPIELFNSGNMQRDFTYIDDVLQAIMAALNFNASFEVFNVGNHQPEEIGRLVSLLEENLGKKAILKLLPMPKGEVVTTFADIQKSQKFLHYKPKTSLKEGIGKFIDWYKSFSQKTAL